jgi:prohibitin 2
MKNKTLIQFIIGGIIASTFFVCLAQQELPKSIQGGAVGIKKTFGKVESEPLYAGIHFIMPFVNSIDTIDLHVQTIKVDEAHASSIDMQTVTTNVVVNYHVSTNDVVNYYIRVGNDKNVIQSTIIAPAIVEIFKSVIAQFGAEELITKRQAVSNLMTNNISKKLMKYNLVVDSVSIVSFKFDDDYAHAIEQKQVAQQNAEKAKNDLARIQVEAEQKIVEAKSQAEAMKTQKEVVTAELIQLKQLEIQSKMVEKWNGVLPNTVMGSNPMATFSINK